MLFDSRATGRARMAPERRSRSATQPQSLRSDSSFVDDLQKKLLGPRIVLPRQSGNGVAPHVGVCTRAGDVEELVGGLGLGALGIQTDQLHAQRTIARDVVHLREIADWNARPPGIAQRHRANIDRLALI